MSVSNAGKDLPINNSNSHERNSSATSTTPDQELNTLKFQQETNQEEEIGKNSASTIKLPSSVGEFNNGVKGFEEDDEPTTPTSSDQKIQVTTTCPPAPRKPKTVPMGNKRKTPSFQRISVDLRVIFDALVDPAEIVTVPDILVGDLGAGDHAKKVKKANVTTGS